MKAIIVGGGIGGLAAAVALATVGCDVTVLEQSERFGEVGSGLSMWPNAVRAVEALGLGDRLHERARPARETVIRDVRGRQLVRSDICGLEHRPLLMVHRADLLEVLRVAVPAGVIRSGVRVIGAAPDGTIVHSDGTEHADLVVGADGIGSVIRTSLWPSASAPRYVGQSAYRMIARLVDVRGSGESWGRGERFGYGTLRDGRVYCFAAVSGPSGVPGESIHQLRRRFGRWHDPIPELLDAVPTDAVLHHDLFELPRLGTYVSGRVALLGDAAHAMTPDLGQGAGQAIEDAVTLAASLTPHRPLVDSLRRYDLERRPRTQAIAARSHRVAAIARWQSAPAMAVRHALLRLSPNRAFLQTLAPVVSWRPPTIRRTLREFGDA